MWSAANTLTQAESDERDGQVYDLLKERSLADRQTYIGWTLKVSRKRAPKTESVV